MKKLFVSFCVWISINGCTNSDLKALNERKAAHTPPISIKQEAKLAAIDSIASSIDMHPNLYTEIDSAIVGHDVIHNITYKESFEKKEAF